MIAAPPRDPAAAVEAAPTLLAWPLVARRVLDELATESPSMNVLADLVASDEALTVAVLRRANSGLAMLSRHVGGVRQALSLVGLKGLWTLAMTEVSRGLVDRSLAPYALARQAMWRHAATTAHTCATFARTLGVAVAEEAEVAGLLHDVGKTVLATACPEAIAHLSLEARNRAVPISVAERNVLGYDHGDVGAALLQEWRLPPRIVDAVAAHHRPGSGDTLTALVDVADIAASWAGAPGGAGGCPPPPVPSEESLAALDLTLDRFHELTMAIEPAGATPNPVAR